MSTIHDIRKKYQREMTPLDFDVLLAHLLRQSKEFLYGYPEYPLSPAQARRWCTMVAQYRRGVPTAYLTGHREWFGLDFFVNKNVLIPRPETELMVEAALGLVRASAGKPGPTVLIDVGTGSGCIPIAVAHGARDCQLRLWGMDISPAALAVARRNAQRHGAKMFFLKSDLLGALHTNRQLQQAWRGGRVVLTANLPYLTTKQIQREPSIAHEPRRALFAAKGGLALYERLLRQVKRYLITLPPKTLVMVCEIDPSQEERLKKMAANMIPSAHITMTPDLANWTRLATIIVK